MAELKNMTVVTSGKLRKTAYDLLDANTNLFGVEGRRPYTGRYFLTAGWHRQMLYILLAI